MNAEPHALAAPLRLGPQSVTAALVHALHTGAVMGRADVSAISLSGPGAVTCLQGLLTNDVEKPGDESFVYAALLTAKGMIIADGWVARRGATVSYTIPTEAADRVRGIFAKSIPPRLARMPAAPGESAVLRVVGPQAAAVVQAAGLPCPAPGRVAQAAQEAAWEVARPGGPAPFGFQVSAPPSAVDALQERLARAGAHEGGTVGLESARVIAGWPRLGSEIDDKTIPQEVRLDELGGVSYTKGCYTGQETVSRLHFRGHVNRVLRGLVFDGEPADGAAAAFQLDKDVGRVTSVCWIPEARVAGGGRWIGLAVLRREIEPGMMIRAAERDARVVDLPFNLPFVAPA